MTREDMLQKLYTVPFILIDPAREWEDIGFTERDIWVNAKGYGWISCDEPTTWCEVRCPESEKWVYIREKLSTADLSVEDIKGTDLLDLLKEITYGDFDEDCDNPCDYLKDLLSLPAEGLQWIYAMDTFDGWQFFATEEDFKKAYERDWCDVSWDELSDEMLLEWIDRLTDEGLFHGEYVVICSTNDLDIDFQEFIESLDDAYLFSSVDSSELDGYLQTAYEQLKDYLIENELETLSDMLSNLYPDVEPNGNISYYDAYDQFIEGSKANILKRFGCSTIQLIAKNATGSIRKAEALPVADLFLEVLEDNTEFSGFDATIGRYIESSLFKFLNDSKWHFGYKNKDGSYSEIQSALDYDAIEDKSSPILWFGLDGEAIIEKWSIEPGKEHGFKWIDQWYLLEYLIDDCTDCFATWYLAECGYDLPDMENILAGCAIQISEDDTIDTVNRKFAEYFEVER